MHTPQKYLFSLTCGILGFIALAATVNYFIDPYGIYGATSTINTEANKPAAASKGPMVKAYQMDKAVANTLVLGNSRAEIGFDPEDPAWPLKTQPVYNAALPGTGTDASLFYLQNALRVMRPSTVVLGVDFPDFLVAPNELPKQSDLPHVSELAARLRVTADGTDNPYRPRQRLRDTVATIFSLSALLDSLRTVAAQNNPYSENLTSRGFNPMRDYALIARNEGYRSMFLQKDQANIKAYLKRPRAIYMSNTETSPPLEELRRIVVTCRDNKIQLKLIIYPYHARLLEIIQATGRWSTFEQWKGALTRIVGEDAGIHSESKFITLWDFSGYNIYSAEPVPQAGDLHSQAKWFWEAGHFKSELGNIVLKKIFHNGNQKNDDETAFGVILSPSNLTEHLIKIRIERDLYLKRYPLEAVEIQSLVQSLSLNTN